MADELLKLFYEGRDCVRAEQLANLRECWDVSWVWKAEPKMENARGRSHRACVWDHGRAGIWLNTEPLMHVWAPDKCFATFARDGNHGHLREASWTSQWASEHSIPEENHQDGLDCKSRTLIELSGHVWQGGSQCPLGQLCPQWIFLLKCFKIYFHLFEN